MWKQRSNELKQFAQNHIPCRGRGRIQTQTSWPISDISSTILTTTLYCCPLRASSPEGSQARLTSSGDGQSPEVVVSGLLPFLIFLFFLAPAGTPGLFFCWYSLNCKKEKQWGSWELYAPWIHILLCKVYKILFAFWFNAPTTLQGLSSSMTWNGLMLWLGAKGGNKRQQWNLNSAFWLWVLGLQHQSAAARGQNQQQKRKSKHLIRHQGPFFHLY